MGIESHLGNNVLTSSLEWLVNWARRSSLWPAGSASPLRSLLVDGIVGGVGGVIVPLALGALAVLTAGRGGGGHAPRSNASRAKSSWIWYAQKYRATCCASTRLGASSRRLSHAKAAARVRWGRIISTTSY